MSWTLNVSAPRAEFDAVVDAATATGQDLELPGVREAVDAAKEALKALAAQTKRPKVNGSANGHTLQADEGANWSDGLAVWVSGSE